MKKVQPKLEPIATEQVVTILTNISVSIETTNKIQFQSFLNKKNLKMKDLGSAFHESISVWEPLTIFEKTLILDVWLGTWYAYVNEV